MRGKLKERLPEAVFHNAALAGIFRQMAACYRYMGPDQRFRAMAYDRAARTIANLKNDISFYAQSLASLDTLNGIGESIAEKIMEYLKTGKIQTFETLKTAVPEDLMSLMDINGFGPATIRLLHDSLGVNNREELAAALLSGEVAQIKGFGEKRIENMKRGLKLFKEYHSRMLLPDALNIGAELQSLLSGIKQVKEILLAGSLRRRKETIGDIDIILTADRKYWKKIIAVIIGFQGVTRVLASGETKASFIYGPQKVQVDIRLVHDFEFGAASLYFTGSKEHNIRLRLMAKEKGWKLNEYGLFESDTDKRIAGRTEAEIYRKLEMDYIPPELREDRGELETASHEELPRLLEEKDIKGDLQMHSTWSDGAESIETIATFIKSHFPHYHYIVITDHSPSERLAHGLKPADFRKQFVEIDKINKKIKSDFVKKGVEVDILADGSLDLPDDLLDQFDWVTASIHSNFNQDNTGRLIRACNHPAIHCIGHPSGRLIGKRNAYPLDWERVFKTAAATGTAMEINAQPERLDLKDDLIQKALEFGVTLTVSTDAHDLDQFSFMAYGVSMARRGWCTAKSVLNAQTWTAIENFKKRKKAMLRH
jgi:DNA polymerase (family 10)